MNTLPGTNEELPPRTPTQEVAESVADKLEHAFYKATPLGQALAVLNERAPKRRNQRDPRPVEFRAAAMMLESARALIEKAEMLLDNLAERH